MNTSTLNFTAFLRGLGYALLGGALNFVALHIGVSGLVSASTAVLITGLIASIEQYLGTSATVAALAEGQTVAGLTLTKTK